NGTSDPSDPSNPALLKSRCLRYISSQGGLPVRRGTPLMDILIIEDDPVIGKAVQKGLTEAGHECQWLKDGTTGLLAANAQKHDVVILDLLIPGEAGLSIIEKLRKGGIRTPILVLTALGSVNDRVTGLKKGADDYLTKPFDL